MCDEKLPIPNIGVCLARIKDYIEKTKNCESCKEISIDALEAVHYMSFILSGNEVWDWVRCSPIKPVIRQE